jgi:CHAT domain-containing protein/tetratricopeptide (TPR) repeat protein
MQRATRLFRAALLSSVSALACALTPSPIRAAPPTAAAFLDSARAEFKAGRAAQSEQLARQALALSPPMSLAAADALDAVVQARHRQALYIGDSRALAERALLLRELLLLPDDAKLDPSVKNLGSQHLIEGDFVAAQASFERLLALRERYDGPRSPKTAQAHEGVGIAWWQQAHYPAARRHFEQALEIRRREHDDAALAKDLWYLGNIDMQLGEHDRAMRSMEKALALRVRALGDSAAAVGETLDAMANVHASAGRRQEARRLYERALAIHLRHDRPLALAQTMGNLAEVLCDLAEYDAARSLLQRAIALRIEHSGEREPWVAYNLCTLAGLEFQVGDSGKALADLDRGLGLMESLIGDHPEVARQLGLLVDALRRMGDCAEAERLAERALAIQERALGRQHLLVGKALRDLGAIQLTCGDPARSLPLLDKARAIADAGKEPGEVARIDLDRATAFTRNGDPGKARKLLESTRTRLAGSFGAQHPLVAECDRASTLAALALGDLVLARAAAERAVAGFRASLGPGAPELRLALGDQAEVLAQSGDLRGALDLALESDRIAREHLRLAARTLPDRQALLYARERGPGLDLAVSLAAALAGDSPDACARAWDAVVRSRTLVLDEMAARAHATVPAADSGTVRLARELTHEQQRLAHLMVRGPGTLSAVEHRKLVEEAQRGVERRERALAQRSVAFRSQQRRDLLGGTQVAAALPAGSVLVSCVRTRSTRPVPHPAGAASRIALRPEYFAFVVRPQVRVPQVVRLGDATAIEDRIDTWRRTFGSPADPGISRAAAAEAECRAAGAELRERIWDPLVGAIGTVERVYWVPDGALDLVDPATLPVGSKDYLVDRGPLVQICTSERDLGTEADPVDSRGLLALGDADFDAATAGVVSWSTSETSPAPAAFARLPASRSEVEQLAALWRRAVAPAVGAVRGACKLLVGAAATEAAFKREVAGRGYVHLAVHAFFGSPSGPSAPGLRGIGAIAPEAPTTLSNPLLQAGLVLAGANRRSDASPEGEDGILTALEIANLDLRSAELVVLSACNTGIGTPSSGEGVLGMRRAFAVAGARCLVVSLWPVHDETASRWMRSFYEARLASGLDTAEATWQAHRDGLARCRAAGTSTHPLFWAGFVATGIQDSPPRATAQSRAIREVSP